MHCTSVAPQSHTYLGPGILGFGSRWKVVTTTTGPGSCGGSVGVEWAPFGVRGGASESS